MHPIPLLQRARWRLATGAAIGLLGAAPVFAATHVVVKDAVVRMPKAGFASTLVFLTLRSDADATLVSASSPIAGTMILRTMTREGVDVHMESVPDVPVRAGHDLQMRTGVGEHFLMAQKIRRPIQPGDIVPVFLKLKQRDGRTVTVTAKATVVAPKSYSPVPEEDLH
jgi:periplasmic copper chaperone A